MRLSVDAPDETAERVKEIAKKRNVSCNAVLCDWIEFCLWLKDRQNEGAKLIVRESDGTEYTMPPVRV